jgi:hypothetical protein
MLRDKRAALATRLTDGSDSHILHMTQTMTRRPKGTSSSRPNFRKVAKHIKKQGWVQGKLRGPKGEICLTQALYETLDRGESYYDKWEYLYNHLGMNPEAWNDHPGRTQKEVLNRLYNL